jgi:lysozyme
MKTSPSGVAFIAAHEGIATKAYRDAGGVWTIGAGHTAAAGPPTPKSGMTMTREEALALLAKDLPAYEQAVETALGGIAAPAFDGAVSFHYNTGAIDRASWVGQYRGGDLAAAEDSLKSWTKAGGKVLRGLVRRRAEEADLIFRSRYPDALAGDGGAAAADADDIASLRDALAKLGYLDAADAEEGATVEAVKRFQAEHGLVVDGIAGPATRATLERALEVRSATGAAIGAGGAGAAAGGVDGVTSSATAGDVVLSAAGWAAVAILIFALAFAAWHYRGAIGLSLQRLIRRKTP